MIIESEQPNIEDPSKKDEGLSAGAIAGIAIGSALGVAAIGGGTFFYMKKK